MNPQEVMTYAEVDQVSGRRALHTYFPEGLEQLGIILGKAVNDDSMIEINKIMIEAELSALFSREPSIFSGEMVDKLTMKKILVISRAREKNFNDLLAHLLREYMKRTN